MSKQNYLCTCCGANWTDGEYSDDCVECGGGAMERGCIVCGGLCDSIFIRAVIDSNDTRVAHWIGSCRLPPSEQEKYWETWKARLEKND